MNFSLLGMDIDEENPASVSPSEVTDDQTPISTIDLIPLPSMQPIIPSLAPPPIVPTIAPIPSTSAPVLQPLAPLSVRPPVLRPPLPQNGEMRGNESDSDRDDSGHARTAVEYEISEESRLFRERQEKAKQELLMKRRASALAVPTNDLAVRTRLRRLGEPITLFGEREMERRDRLRMIMAKLDADGQLDKLMKAHEEEEAASVATEEVEEESLQYPFYTEGPKSLLEARVDIAKYSIVRAASRLHRARRKRDDPDEDLDAEMDWVLQEAGNLVLDCSEIGDDRPLSGCSFSHDGRLLATWYSLFHVVPFYV